MLNVFDRFDCLFCKLVPIVATIEIDDSDDEGAVDNGRNSEHVSNDELADGPGLADDELGDDEHTDAEANFEPLANESSTEDEQCKHCENLYLCSSHHAFPSL